MEGTVGGAGPGPGAQPGSIAAMFRDGEKIATAR